MGISPMAMLALGAMGGAAVSAIAAPQKSPQVSPPPQATQTATPQGQLAAMMGKGATGGAGGVASTFLTGSGGIDPSLLNIGKNTLLGQ